MLADFICARYGEKMRLPASIVSLTRPIILTGMQFLAISTAMTVVFDTSVEFGVVVSSIIILLYLITAGQYSALITQWFQSILQSLGIILFAAVAFKVVGNPTEVTEAFYNVLPASFVDFFALDNGSYAQAILNSCSLGMIMATEPVALSLLRDSLDLEQREVDIVQGLERGQALLVGSGSSVAIKIVSSKLEHELITTDVHELNSIVDEKMQQMAENTMPEQAEEAPTPGEMLSAVRRQSSQLIPIGRKKVKL